MWGDELHGFRKHLITNKFDKKENVHLDEQYFDVISSKTENGIHKVPIVDKVLPFYQSWFDSAPDCEYLLHTEEKTNISLLAEAGVDQTIIKRLLDIRKPCL